MSKLTFADYFNIQKNTLDKYGAINPCVAYDLPLFVDPFLIFASDKPEYKELHGNIIKYLRFLYEESKNQVLSAGRFKHLFVFPEIKQNWFGYTVTGNQGRGGSSKMGKALRSNLNELFNNHGIDEINNVIHLTEVSLLEKGIGPDNISDFTTQLIFDYLLTYTENFTKKCIASELRKEFAIGNAYFSYETKRWLPKKYTLPNFHGDFVILVPNDIVVRDHLWLNKEDILASYEHLPTMISNIEIRDSLNNYFVSKLPVLVNEKGKKREAFKYEKENAASSVIKRYPIARKFYLKYKEDHKKLILQQSQLALNSLKELTLDIPRLASQIAVLLNNELKIKEVTTNSYEEALLRINYLKKVIEKQDGYRYFYNDGVLIRREEDLQRYFKAVWFDTKFDINAEVNNGRGPVDFKVSMGQDQTLIEFKLASNGQLKNNLLNQTEIYAEANNNPSVVKVIIFFTLDEETKLKKVLKEIGMDNKENVIIIDARNDNKQSASKVTAV